MKYLRSKRATYFGNLKTLERTHGFKVFHISVVVLIIKIIMVLLLYMVATNNIMIRSYEPITDTDFLLLIDDSSSMAKSDFPPNRLTSAKAISKKWLDILPNSTMVGLVAFSSGIDHAINPTFDRERIKERIDSIEIDYAKSGTDLDYAINYGLDLLNDSQRQKTILLFTDGTQAVQNKTIEKALDANAKIVSFGIGNSDEVELFEDIPDEFKDTYSTLEFNFSLLEDLSRRTEGDAYQVSNEVELQESFNRATLKEAKVRLNSSYYIALLIAIISILELLIYARLGAL